MFSFFKKKSYSNFLITDIHSHLLPGLDDGVKTWEESIDILRSLEHLGIKKVITTPHIMSGYYENTPEIIESKLSELTTLIEKTDGLSIEVKAAAEYYVDEHFLRSVEQNERLLFFGDNLILIETSFLNKPALLFELIFLLQSKGYQPILAHPERYIYIQEDYKLLNEILKTNTLLQVNASSFTGYYSPTAKKVAEQLVKDNHIGLLGSDIHNQRHLRAFEQSMDTKYFQRCGQLNLINNSL